MTQGPDLDPNTAQEMVGFSLIVVCFSDSIHFSCTSNVLCFVFLSQQSQMFVADFSLEQSGKRITEHRRIYYNFVNTF